MNYSVFRFTLNMHNHRSQVAIPVFLGDTGIRLFISITDGGNPYFIEDGCMAVIRGKKPDGKHIFNQCLILNNTTIQYDFTEQTSNVEGIVNCEIDLYDSEGKLVTAPKFIIVVDSRTVLDSTIEDNISEEEHTAIAQAMSFAAAEELRVNAEKARADAEKLRVNAEKARADAEEERKKSSICAVLYSAQTLTDEQKEQARANIGAIGAGGGGMTDEEIANLESMII